MKSTMVKRALFHSIITCKRAMMQKVLHKLRQQRAHWQQAGGRTSRHRAEVAKACPLKSPKDPDPLVPTHLIPNTLTETEGLGFRVEG